MDIQADGLNIHDQSLFNTKKSVLNHMIPSSGGCEINKDEINEENYFTKIDEIEVEGFIYRREQQQLNFKVDTKSWNIVVDNIKRLDRENIDMKERVKIEINRCEDEVAEKDSLKRQLKHYREEMTKMNKMFKELPNRKSVIEQILKSETVNVIELKQEFKLGPRLDSFSGCHGFTEEEAVSAVASARKTLLDKIIASEEQSIDTLHGQISEVWKKSQLEKSIQEDEFNASREWSEMGSFLGDTMFLET